jgi:hypothetical protein
MNVVILVRQEGLALLVDRDSRPVAAERGEKHRAATNGNCPLKCTAKTWE